MYAFGTKLLTYIPNIKFSCSRIKDLTNLLIDYWCLIENASGISFGFVFQDRDYFSFSRFLFILTFPSRSSWKYFSSFHCFSFRFLHSTVLCPWIHFPSTFWICFSKLELYWRRECILFNKRRFSENFCLKHE